ncbi:MAG: PorT family protein [Paludibacter sp.]|jgi:hypothetical protein|nr:PorT family protein [Paludibacter sp.]
MKKIILIAAMAAFTLSIYAQLGVQVGYILPTDRTKIEKNKSSSSINGIQAGVNYTYFYNDNLFVQPALLYSFGGKSDSKSGKAGMWGDYKFTSAFTSHSIDLPIHIGYALPIGDDLKVFAFAGPDFQYNIDQKTSFKSNDPNINNVLAFLGLSGGSVYGTKDHPNKDLSHWDILLGAGIGATYKNMTFKAGFDFGLMNKYTGDVKNKSIHTNVFSVALGYSF